MSVQLTPSQKEAIESIDKSVLVTAGAGSGKTFVLVRRFVEILQKHPELSVHNLLAVTYTRKAANEMRTRIKARLKELYEKAKENNAQEQIRWHQCLSDMDSAYIGTIHSLCQTILRSFTVDIGLDPQIEILDEIERAQIIQEAIEGTFRQIITAQNSNKDLLEHFSLETVESFLQIALNGHLQFNQIAKDLENLSNEQLSDQIEQLLTRTQKQLLTDLIIDEDWHRAGHYIKSSPYAEAVNKLEEVRQQAAKYFENIQEFIKSLNDNENIKLQQTKIKGAWEILLNMANMGRVRVGGNTDTAKEMRATIKTLIEKCKDYSQYNKKGYGLPLWFSMQSQDIALFDHNKYWQLWRELLAIARLAQNIYATKKLELGKLDYDDLIAKTKVALEMPNSTVRNYYNKILAHILVDEFQDTNPIQSKIITLLAGENTKLFLIGDDKQSIYKFQGADVSTFNIWQRQGIDSLVFEHSFRSHKEIVGFVNNIFSTLLPIHKAHVDYRAKYVALKAERQFTSIGSGDAVIGGGVAIATQALHPNVEIIQLPDIAESDKSLDEIEGKAVVNWIYDKVKKGMEIVDQKGEYRPLDFGDFAILTARNSDLQIFETCLSELGIPYVTSGGRTFLERQEIYDLENMLLFLSNPSNSHALLAVLRSPMLSITDDFIHNLACTNAQSLWQSMQDYVSKQVKGTGYQNLAEAVIILKRLLADLPALTLSELIYRIIRDTNYDLIALTLPDGKQRYKNIWKFYMLAKDELSPSEFAKRFELSRQLSVSETNAAMDNKQSVKLMTIHAAKGLEFPAVVLPALSNSINYNKSKLLLHHQFGIVLNTARTEQERDEGVPLPYQLGRTLDDDMDIAEKTSTLCRND